MMMAKDMPATWATMLLLDKSLPQRRLRAIETIANSLPLWIAGSTAERSLQEMSHQLGQEPKKFVREVLLPQSIHLAVAEYKAERKRQAVSEDYVLLLWWFKPKSSSYTVCVNVDRENAYAANLIRKIYKHVRQ